MGNRGGVIEARAARLRKIHCIVFLWRPGLVFGETTRGSLCLEISLKGFSTSVNLHHGSQDGKVL
jgi:hypothetical protein